MNGWSGVREDRGIWKRTREGLTADVVAVAVTRAVAEPLADGLGVVCAGHVDQSVWLVGEWLGVARMKW